MTPEIQGTLIASVRAEVGSRSIDELAAERDDLLRWLLELRTNAEMKTQADAKVGKVA